MPNTLPKPLPEEVSDRVPTAREIENSVIEFYKHTAILLGIPQSLAAIYGLFFATTTPLCLQDVAERLNLSQGSVSNGLRFLKEVGALKTIPGPQPRREYYVIDLHIRSLIKHLLDERIDKFLAEGTQRIDRIKAQLKAHELPALLPPEETLTEDTKTEIQDRVDQLESWHKKTRGLLPMVKVALALG